ncbi:MAG TPA: alanine racemase [Actinomycetota bacterium]|jgi:D-serine deaminase-like pyridoxal phosphate-dependent protein
MNAPALGLLRDVRIDGTSKGMPPVSDPVPLLEAGARGWTLDDLEPPFVVLRRSALEHNVSLMAAYCDDHRVSIAPHGKTTMAPQLWRRQLEAGAWGISAATTAQARVMRAAGVPRILVANPLTDVAAIRWAAHDLREDQKELACYVDSERGVELLEAVLREEAPARPLPVLLELGHAGGRTGCRGAEEALAIARRVASSPSLSLVGLAGYEGTIAHDRGATALEAVRRYLVDLRALGIRLQDEGLLSGTALMSVGGSVYFDLVVEELGTMRSDVAMALLLRAGAYVVHDVGMYERSSPFAHRAVEGRFRNAIEVWGAVLSTPEDGLAIVGLGRRDVSFDQGLPRLLAARRGDGVVDELDGVVEATALDDQHLYCRVRADARLSPGDLVACGISHPCSMLDRWRLIPVVDDDDAVVEVVATFF